MITPAQIAAFHKYRIDISHLPDSEQPVYASCPECSSAKKVGAHPSLQISVATGDWICHHCGFAGNLLRGALKKRNNQWLYTEWRTPTFEPNPLPPKLISWFKSRGISAQTVEAFKVGYSQFYFPKHEEFRPCLRFPYFRENSLVNIKSRDNFKQFELEKGCERIFYQLAHLNEEATLIVEAEMDTLSLSEAGYNNVIGVPYTPVIKDANYEDNFDYLLSAEPLLAPVKKFILALSSTPQGKKLEEELARRLGKERCWRVTWPEDCKDANQMLCNKGVEELQKIVESARPYPIKGIFEACDVSDKIDALYDFGLPRGAPTGWLTLDPHYTVKEGQWTLVTGIPGHGKSNFLDAMLVNVAEKENWRFGMFSPENQPIERHFANLMEKYADAPFSFGHTERMSVETKERAKEWVNEHFYVILPDEDEGNWSVDGILQLAKALVFRKGIKGLVIDPWNELDHSRTSGMTETEHISQALTKIRQFARSHAVHVWVVAHPAKLYKDADGKYPVPTPYDVSGSSHWNNKADNSITVWRNRGGKDEEVADIHVQKIRFKEVGMVGMISLRYNKTTGRFVDDIDQGKRQESLEKGLETPTDDLRIFSGRKK